MSQQEVKRAQVMELLTAGKIDQKEAGKRLAVSVRQIKRIVRRYRTEGLPGLMSKKRGTTSNSRLSEDTKRLSTELIGTQELRWRKRKLSYTSMTKAPRQAAEADRKIANEQVDKALAKRSKTNKWHKPAANHPLRNTPVAKSATEVA